MVSANEVDTVSNLAHEVWHEHYTPILGEKQVAYMLRTLQSPEAISKAVYSDGYDYFIISLNGQNAGYIGVLLEGERLFLSKLYLLKNFRGKHLASAAMDFLKTTYPAKVIWLTCNKHNDNTIAAYKKLGFEVVSSQKADIGEGYVMDDYIMEKRV